MEELETLRKYLLQARGLSIEDELERQGDLCQLPLIVAIDRWRESYSQIAPDEGAWTKIADLSPHTPGLITYFGKLDVNGSPQNILLTLPELFSRSNCRLLLVGGGPLREALEIMVEALDLGDGETLQRLAKLGKRLQGEIEEPFMEMNSYLRSLQKSERWEEWLEKAASCELAERVRFIGFMKEEFFSVWQRLSTVVLCPEVASATPIHSLTELLLSKV